MKLDEIDLSPVLTHVAAEIGRQYPDVEIMREIPEVLSGAADPVRFAEIVRQLLDNACRYTHEGMPVVLKGRAMDEGVVVSVTDGGEGMRRQTVSKAFDEPFAAGEDILRKERAGAGVGLHMARQLVLQHGGIMWADPVPAGGTRVSFVIPTRPGERAIRPRLADPPPLARPEPDAADVRPANVVPLPQRNSRATSS
jgi:signal transduction histidine kinase